MKTKINLKTSDVGAERLFEAIQTVNKSTMKDWENMINSLSLSSSKRVDIADDRFMKELGKAGLTASEAGETMRKLLEMEWSGPYPIEVDPVCEECCNEDCPGVKSLGDNICMKFINPVEKAYGNERKEVEKVIREVLLSKGICEGFEINWITPEDDRISSSPPGTPSPPEVLDQSDRSDQSEADQPGKGLPGYGGPYADQDRWLGTEHDIGIPDWDELDRDPDIYPLIREYMMEQNRNESRSAVLTEAGAPQPVGGVEENVLDGPVEHGALPVQDGGPAPIIREDEMIAPCDNRKEGNQCLREENS